MWKRKPLYRIEPQQGLYFGTHREKWSTCSLLMNECVKLGCIWNMKSLVMNCCFSILTPAGIHQTHAYLHIFLRPGVLKLLIQFFSSSQLRSSLVVLQQNFALANRTAEPQWCNHSWRLHGALDTTSGPLKRTAALNCLRGVSLVSTGCCHVVFPRHAMCCRGLRVPEPMVRHQVPGCLFLSWRLTAGRTKLHHKVMPHLTNSCARLCVW